MTLTLSILRCPDAVPPQTRTVTGGEFTIGRGADNDWMLPDPDKVLSKKHCIVAFRSGGWQVMDCSTNGTFLNRDDQPVGQGAVRDLRDGDRLRLGPYEIELRIAVDEAPAWQPDAARRSRRAAAFDDDPLAPPPPLRRDNPFADEPWPRSSDAIPGGPRDGGFGTTSDPKLPDDFGLDVDDFLTGPTQSDHAPATEQSFAAPQPAPPQIPDNWDLDLSPTHTPTAAPPQPAAASPPAPAVAATPPQPSADQDDLMAAFLRGAGITGVTPTNPAGTMEQVGETFRALVAGLRETLIARASVKGEFRIEQTMIRARGNNPLKFSADDDDALAALLGTGRRTDVTPAEAVTDALRDIRLHELATMTAMQTAVRALLQRLDPARLRAEAEQSGGLLPAQRRARAFETFEKLHADITRGLSDDFDSVFGKAFARAYEQALHEIAAKER